MLLMLELAGGLIQRPAPPAPLPKGLGPSIGGCPPLPARPPAAQSCHVALGSKLGNVRSSAPFGGLNRKQKASHPANRHPAELKLAPLCLLMRWADSGATSQEERCGMGGKKTSNIVADGVQATGPHGTPLLSVVVPTRDEAENIEELTRRLAQAAGKTPVEIIFVDDSRDNTPQVIEEVGKRSELDVQLIHRPPENRSNGLGGAVVEGLRAARAPWVCVMDGDLQHPPELLPQMLREAEDGDADVVVASRYCGEAKENGLSRLRGAISRSLILAARMMFPISLRSVSDPLSGFFLVRRDAVDLDKLRPRGFKILLEILVRTPGLRAIEVPFEFGVRRAGQTKASPREALTYFSQLGRLRLSVVPERFARFAAVGATGLLVNNLVLAFATEAAGVHYLVSAVIATQASTLWNFALAELLVFSDRQPGSQRVFRLAMFLVVNNIGLAARGPFIYILTSALGVHYIISNLASIIAFTIARYAVADLWIWAEARGASGRSTMLNYNIHDIIKVASEVRLPELDRFLVDEPIEEPTIRVRLGKVTEERESNGAPPQASVTAQSNGPSLHYKEWVGSLGFGMRIEMGEPIEVLATPLLRRSPHVLYTNIVEPLLRWTFVEKGYALVHGACVAFGDEAFLITAKTDTGKTTTILRLLDNLTCSFISDDLTLVSRDGQVLTYPKPLTISRHTVTAVKSAQLSRWERSTLIVQSRVHSRSGRIFAHFIAKTRLPAATINTIVQRLIPPPKYQVDRLVPGTKIVRQAQLAGMFIIEKGEEAEVVLEDQEAMDILMSNCEDAYGFPPYHEIEGFLHSSNGRDLRPRERDIVAGALSGRPTVLLRSSTMDWWRRLRDVLGESVSTEVATGSDKKTPELKGRRSGAVIESRHRGGY